MHLKRPEAQAPRAVAACRVPRTVVCVGDVTFRKSRGNSCQYCQYCQHDSQQQKVGCLPISLPLVYTLRIDDSIKQLHGTEHIAQHPPPTHAWHRDQRAQGTAHRTPKRNALFMPPSRRSVSDVAGDGAHLWRKAVSTSDEMMSDRDLSLRFSLAARRNAAASTYTRAHVQRYGHGWDCARARGCVFVRGWVNG